MSSQALLPILSLFAVKSAAILLLVALACRVLHGLGASYRHLFRTAGFCAILVLPILGAVLPRQKIAILPPAPAAKALPHFDAPLPAPDAFTPTHATIESWPDDSAPEPLAVTAPVKPKTPVSAPFVIWLIGAGVILAQYALSLILLSRSAAKAAKADTGLYAAITLRAGFSRRWSLLLGDVAGMPSPKTWGVFRPVIAMPLKSSDWPEEQFETVLMHELIHARRLDFLTQSLATVACALNWFNPLAWLALRAMRLEAENAADDAVLLSGVKPSVYAQALLQAAAEFQSPNNPFLSAGVPLMKQSKIEARVRAILNSERPVRRINRLGAMTLVGISLLIAVPCAALQATNQTPATQKLAAERDAAGRQPTSDTTAHKVPVQHHASGSSDQLQKYRAELAELRAELSQQRREMMLMRLAMEDEYRERTKAKAVAEASQRAEGRANFEQDKANLAAARAQIDSIVAKLEAEKAHVAESQARYKAGIDTADAYQTAVADAKSNEAGLKAAQAEYQAVQAKMDAEKMSAGGHKGPELRREENSLRGSLEASEAEMNALRAKIERERALEQHGFKSKAQSQNDQERLKKALAEVEALNVRLKALFDSGK